MKFCHSVTKTFLCHP